MFFIFCSIPEFSKLHPVIPRRYVPEWTNDMRNRELIIKVYNFITCLKINLITLQSSFVCLFVYWMPVNSPPAKSPTTKLPTIKSPLTKQSRPLTYKFAPLKFTPWRCHCCCKKRKIERKNRIGLVCALLGDWDKGFMSEVFLRFLIFWWKSNCLSLKQWLSFLSMFYAINSSYCMVIN